MSLGCSYVITSAEKEQYIWGCIHAGFVLFICAACMKIKARIAAALNINRSEIKQENLVTQYMPLEMQTYLYIRHMQIKSSQAVVAVMLSLRRTGGGIQHPHFFGNSQIQGGGISGWVTRNFCPKIAYPTIKLVFLPPHFKNIPTEHNLKCL